MKKKQHEQDNKSIHKIRANWWKQLSKGRGDHNTKPSGAHGDLGNDSGLSQSREWGSNQSFLDLKG